MKTKLLFTFLTALVFLCMKPAMANSPFFEDFEGETFPPEGWTVYSLLDETQNWELNLWQNITPGGTQSAFHNSTSEEESVDNWLVTPLISISSDGFHYLSIWSYLANSWGYKKSSLLISTGSPDPANGDYVEKWAGISNDGWVWKNFFIDLQEYIGQDVYIAFRYEGDTWGHSWNVDDVALVDDSPIINLSTLEVSQAVGVNGTGAKTIVITNDGIQDLTFNAEIEYLNADGWLSVDPVSGSVASQSAVEISLAFDANGLDTGVFQANLIINSNDSENPVDTVLVTLEVIDVNVYPFTEDFESETFPPIGWTNYNQDNDETEWALSWYNNTPGGQYSALHSYSWAPQDGWLVTPQISVPLEGFFYLSFWSLVGDAVYYDKNSVLVSTGSGNPADEDFVEVWTEENVSDNWTQRFVNLEEYAGQDIFIAFRYEGEFAHFWAIDDISLGEEIDDSPIMIVDTSEISQTVGQDGSGSKSFKVINDGIQNLTFDIEVEFTDGDGWLTAEPISGSISAKSFQSISLAFDANGLEIGAYQANVTVTSNDTENPTATVVATLNVMEAQPISLTVIYPEYTFPTAISSDGMYVSGSQFGGMAGYLWSKTDGIYNFAGDVQGVDDNGIIVGTYDTEFLFDGIEVNTAGFWNRSTMEWEFLGMNPDVPEFFGTFYNTGYGITGDGSTVVGMQWYPDWVVKAFKWTEADGYDILSPDFSANTRANGISANGSVIYGWAEPNWTRTAAIWYNDEMILIDETQYGEAWGASPSGNYVTGGIGADGFIWSPTEGVTLFQNTLSSGAISPTSVLDDGTVFGYTSGGWPPTPDTRRAFVRHPNGTMETFNEYVAGRGWFDASDWIFFSVNDATPDGNIFIGAAELPSGEWISFMVDFAPAQPVIEINPTSITESLDMGDSSEQTLEISNTGEGDLVYSAVIQYVIEDAKVQEVPTGSSTRKGDMELTKKENTDGFHPATKSNDKNGIILNYDGANVDAIGLIAGGTFYGAARYTSEMVAPFGGYMLESVDVYIGDIPSEIKLIVWDAGTTTTPGALLHEQVFTPEAASWNTVTLDEALAVSGADLWVGFEITHDAGVFVLGIDGGPANLDGNLLSQDAVEWEHLSDYGLNANWNIRARLQYGGVQWLTIDPSSGAIAEDQSQIVTVNFDATGLEPGTYTANIRISNNSINEQLIIVPVTLEVTGELMYTLTLLLEPEVAGVVTGAGAYAAGTVVTVNAVANEGYEFVNWTDTGDNIVSEVAENEITITGDLTLIANFLLISNVDDVWENQLTIFPNPASDIMNFMSDEIIRNLELYNLTGQKVYSAEVNVNNYKLDVSALPQGFYLVRLTSVNGDILTTRILIAR